MLVGEDHQLLDEHVGFRLTLQPCPGDTALAVEIEDDFRRLHLQGTACKALCAQLSRQRVVQLERLDDGGRRLTSFRLRVGQSCVGTDHRPVERRLTGRWDLDGDAEPVLVRPERAEVVGELVRQHRGDRARDVCRKRSLRGTAVEGRALAHEPGDVGDVHPGADPALLAPERQRVVEVLGGIGIDGVGEQIAEVDPALGGRSHSVVRLERDARPFLDEQRLEHVVDPRRGSERTLDPCASTPGSDECQLTRPDSTAALRLQHDRHAGREVRLTDEKPPAAANFDDQRRTGVRRRGRGTSVCQARCRRAR